MVPHPGGDRNPGKGAQRHSIVIPRLSVVIFDCRLINNLYRWCLEEREGALYGAKIEDIL